MNLFGPRTKPQVGKMVYTRVSEIKLHRDFQTLFPINPTVRDAIAASIRKNGFDENHPLVIWQEQGYVVDGHTRLSASKLVGLRKVPVIYKSFPNLEAALEYARRLQFDRRNLTDPDLFAYVLRLDVDNLPSTGRKQERLARLCNISVTKAVRIIKVKKDGSKKQHDAILKGSTTIHATYEQMKPSRVRTNSGSSRFSASGDPTVVISESVIISMISRLAESQDKSLDVKDIACIFTRQLPKGPTKSKALGILEDRD